MRRFVRKCISGLSAMCQIHDGIFKLHVQTATWIAVEFYVGITTSFCYIGYLPILAFAPINNHDVTAGV